MGIFDKITDTLTETGQDIKRKADQTSARSQLNSELRKKEKERESLVYQIGYELVSNAPDVCRERCPETYGSLLQAREAAKQLRNQLALSEAEIVCPGCGRTIKGAAPFCTYCGSRLPQPNIGPVTDSGVPGAGLAVKDPSGELCSNCGAPLKKGASFCVRCGTRIEKKEAPAEQPAEGPAVCKNCGAELMPDDVFCTNCGTRR